MKKLKAAVIGTGGISNCHIEAYLNNPNTELYAFCDINSDTLKKMAEKYGIPEERCFTDKDEMLKALPEIDIVSVTTWNSAHAECAIAALNAGKDVICEKPTAITSEQAVKMKEAADKNGKLLQIGFVRRHGRDCKILKDFIDNGYFGDVYYAKATYLRRNGCPGGWFGDKSRSGGGPLLDLGVHVIDLARYLMGKPKVTSVYGITFSKLGNRLEIKNGSGWRPAGDESRDIFDVEDFAGAIIRFDNGAVINVETSFSLNVEKDRTDIEIFGTKAGAKLDPDVKIFTDMNGYTVNTELTGNSGFEFSKAFQTEIDHFVDCVLNGTKCIADADDGIEIMKILDAVYESARTGHEVIIGE